MKKYNFSAGPSVLPQEVVEKAAAAVVEFDGTGLSLAEISHRNKAFVNVMEGARALVKEILEVPEGYSVLFLQGGASLQFIMVAYNFMKVGGKAAYINTGVWSDKAIKEAKKFGEVEVIASSEDKNHTYIPKDFVIPEDVDYVHFTSNNTIFGTQFKNFPKTDKPLICDMSSDIFSRKVNVSDFALIYAGAQKNVGSSGSTIIIVKDELLGKTGRDIPSYLDYQVQIKNDSMFNTPACFAVYTSKLTLEWLKSLGGLDYIEKYNEKKAKMLYDELDRNPLFIPVAEKEDRSLMNVTFVLKDEATHKEKFDALCKEAGILDVKGHRLVGGYRASIYNAMSIEGIEALIKVMQTLEKEA